MDKRLITLLLMITLLAGCKKKDDTTSIDPDPHGYNKCQWLLGPNYSYEANGSPVSDLGQVQWGMAGQCHFLFFGWLTDDIRINILDIVSGPGKYDIPAYTEDSCMAMIEGVYVHYNGHKYANKQTLVDALDITALSGDTGIGISATFEFPVTNLIDDLDTVWVTNGVIAD